MTGFSQRFKIDELMLWKNTIDGSHASIYGAIPSGDAWVLVSVGFILRDRDRGPHHCLMCDRKQQIVDSMDKAFPNWREQ